MGLLEAYKNGQFGLSFELFPPKTTAGEAALMRHVTRLLEFKPSYFTCTYGAGGSTQDKTLAIAAAIREQTKLPVATHLTCVGRTAEQICDYLSRAVEQDVQNVVALRGDPPQGETEFRPVEGGFSYANELVAMIRERFAGMDIAVGGYPEVHQEAPNRQVDLENLKRKIDAGADLVITQLFYDNDDYFRFLDDCQKGGIDAPIVPGLLPITNAAQIKRITSMCAAKLPEALAQRLDAVEDDADAQAKIGIEHAVEQTRGLVDAGVPGIHFYVLNKSETTSQVLQGAGVSGEG